MPSGIPKPKPRPRLVDKEPLPPPAAAAAGLVDVDEENADVVDAVAFPVGGLPDAVLVPPIVNVVESVAFNPTK